MPRAGGRGEQAAKQAPRANFGLDGRVVGVKVMKLATNSPHEKVRLARGKNGGLSLAKLDAHVVAETIGENIAALPDIFPLFTDLTKVRLEVKAPKAHTDSCRKKDSDGSGQLFDANHVHSVEVQQVDQLIVRERTEVEAHSLIDGDARLTITPYDVDGIGARRPHARERRTMDCPRLTTCDGVLFSVLLQAFEETFHRLESADVGKAENGDGLEVGSRMAVRHAGQDILIQKAFVV